MRVALVEKCLKNAIFIHKIHIFIYVLTYIREKKIIYIKNKLKKFYGIMLKAKK